MEDYKRYKTEIELETRIGKTLTNYYKSYVNKICNEENKNYIPDTTNNLDECVTILLRKLKKLHYQNPDFRFVSQDKSRYILEYMNPMHIIFMSFRKGNEVIDIYDDHYCFIGSFNTREYDKFLTVIKRFHDIICHKDKIIERVIQKYRITSKLSEIAQTSIKTLCESVYTNKNDYVMRFHNLYANLYVKNEKGNIYFIHVVYKGFLENSKSLVNVLKEPCEHSESWLSSTILFTDTLNRPVKDWDLVQASPSKDEISEWQDLLSA